MVGRKGGYVNESQRENKGSERERNRFATTRCRTPNGFAPA